VLTFESRGRLPALYSDFRPQRTLNPDGYRANISAWRHAISRLASQGALARHHGDSSPLVVKIDNALLRQLESKQFGQPLALGTAVREAVEARDLVPLQDFLKAPQSIYHRGWGEVPWSVVGWTLRQLGIADPARGEDKLPTGHYVVMENVEAAARELGDRMAGKTSIFDRVFTKAQFQSEFAGQLVQGQRLSDNDLHVLLRFLSRDKEMIEYDGQTIRIKGSGEEGRITEQDATMASIKELTASLKHQVHLLNDRIEELETSAKAAIARKNRVTALAALKSKKLAESSLSTRYATLNQLEEVAAKIQQAADHVALVKVMEASTGVLQGLNKAVGGAEKVDGVMDRLREQMADADEVAAILAESAGAPVDEGEIDDELEAMEAQEKAKEETAQQEREASRRREEEVRQAAEAQKKLDELPQVPVDGEMRRERERTPPTPTAETGIANLSVKDGDEREREAKPMASS
jgi:charged multivesicular body protein 7